MKVQGTTGLKIIHGSLLSIKETEVAIRLIIRGVGDKIYKSHYVKNCIT